MLEAVLIMPDGRATMCWNTGDAVMDRPMSLNGVRMRIVPSSWRTVIVLPGGNSTALKRRMK